MPCYIICANWPLEKYIRTYTNRRSISLYFIIKAEKWFSAFVSDCTSLINVRVVDVDKGADENEFIHDGVDDEDETMDEYCDYEEDLVCTNEDDDTDIE